MTIQCGVSLELCVPGMSRNEKPIKNPKEKKGLKERQLLLGYRFIGTQNS